MLDVRVYPSLANRRDGDKRLDRCPIICRGPSQAIASMWHRGLYRAEPRFLRGKINAGYRPASSQPGCHRGSREDGKHPSGGPAGVLGLHTSDGSHGSMRWAFGGGRAGSR